jgi:tetratricopeptide (TPR) repeat protein
MQNALAFVEQGDVDRAIRYLEKADDIDPKNVYFTRNLAAIWIEKVRQQSSVEMAEKYRRIAYSYRAKADEMGWTRDPDANTRRKP